MLQSGDILNRVSLLDAVLQQIPVGVVVAEAPSGKLVVVNDQVEKIWRSSLIARNHIDEYEKHEGYHPDGQRYKANEWPIARALTKGEFISEEQIRFRRGDGTYGVMRVSAKPVMDENGKIVAAVSIMMDVTERMEVVNALHQANVNLQVQTEELEVQAEELQTQTEEILSANQQFLEIESLNRALNDINQLIYSTLDFTEIMRRTVSAAAEALGSETAAISLRKADRWVVSYIYGFPEDTVGKEMNDREELHALLAIQTKMPVAVDDAYTDARVNRDHMRKWGVRSVLVVPIIVRHEAIGVIFFNYHKSARKFKNYQIDFATKLAASISLALENARLFENLKNEINERKHVETILRAYTEQLKTSNEELERFAFVASHDLQAPLRKIELFSEQLQKIPTASLGETERLYLERMQVAAKRMRALINDLLTLARVTTSGKPFEKTDLQQVAKSVASDLDSLIQQTGGKVIIEDLPTIEADPKQMRQLLQNLIENALKFHEPAVPPQVTIRSEPGEQNQTRVLVEDNGIGFDMRYYEQIFEPFKRLHSDMGFEGTGIGLSICAKITDRHNGSITAKSEPGQGSTFTVTLPVKQ